MNLLITLHRITSNLKGTGNDPLCSFWEQHECVARCGCQTNPLFLGCMTGATTLIPVKALPNPCDGRGHMCFDLYRKLPSAHIGYLK
eukprot:scaffold46797_cov19-Tisochrysis_lutea.AAC.1